jgi:hypothetical protein
VSVNGSVSVSVSSSDPPKRWRAPWLSERGRRTGMRLMSSTVRMMAVVLAVASSAVSKCWSMEMIMSMRA